MIPPETKVFQTTSTCNSLERHLPSVQISIFDYKPKWWFPRRLLSLPRLCPPPQLMSTTSLARMAGFRMIKVLRFNWTTEVPSPSEVDGDFSGLLPPCVARTQLLIPGHPAMEVCYQAKLAVHQFIEYQLTYVQTSTSEAMASFMTQAVGVTCFQSACRIKDWLFNRHPNFQWSAPLRLSDLSTDRLILEGRVKYRLFWTSERVKRMWRIFCRGDVTLKQRREKENISVDCL